MKTERQKLIDEAKVDLALVERWGNSIPGSGTDLAHTHLVKAVRRILKILEADNV